jgi:hypothetical protein
VEGEFVMANILTAAEAAIVLRCEATDADMLQLLPVVDAYIKLATGRDWTLDTTIEPLAKGAARILLTQWHEDPGMMIAGAANMSGGLRACLAQLEAKALLLVDEGIPTEALELVSAPEDGELTVAISVRPLLVFNHAMRDYRSEPILYLYTAAGVPVPMTLTIDSTNKRFTITPTSSLAAGTEYKVVFTNAADVFGQTLTQTIRFRTASS